MAWNWDIQNSRSTGGRFACISSASKAVPLRPPVMCLVAAPWIEQRSLVAFAEPADFCECGNLYGGTYHTSDA